MCKTCSKQIAKYNQTLNYALEIIVLPAVGMLKLFLHLLEPLYKVCLHTNPQSKFFLMQYFRRLASKVFLFTVMVTCLLVYYSILLNLSTNQALLVGHSVTFYLAATTFILTTFGLPFGFLVVFDGFDAGSSHSTEPPVVPCFVSFPWWYVFELFLY